MAYLTMEWNMLLKLGGNLETIVKFFSCFVAAVHTV